MSIAGRGPLTMLGLTTVTPKRGPDVARLEGASPDRTHDVREPVLTGHLELVITGPEKWGVREPVTTGPTVWAVREQVREPVVTGCEGGSHNRTHSVKEPDVTSPV